MSALTKGHVTAAVFGSAAGALFYNLLPMYLGMAQEYRGYDNVAIGIIGFAFFLGFNLATSSAYFWIRRVNWRVTSVIAAPLAAAGMSSVVLFPGFTFLLISVCIAGAAFSIIYGICATVLSESTDPARWYGAKIAAETLSGAILFLILPSLVLAQFGFDGLVVALGICVLISIPFLMRLPDSGDFSKEITPIDVDLTQGKKSAIFLMLAAILLWFCGQTVLWTFVERIGAHAGLSTGSIGLVLAITLVTATVGSLTSMWASDRWGNFAPFYLASLLFLGSAPMLLTELQFLSYLLSAGIVMYSVGLGVPYCYSIIADLDFDGRYSVLTVPAVGLGAMVAPVVAGFLVTEGDFTKMIFAACALVVTAMLLARRSQKIGSVSSA